MKIPVLILMRILITVVIQVPIKVSVKYYPLSSEELSIYEVDMSQFKSEKVVHIDRIVTKYVVLPLDVNCNVKYICVHMLQMKL